MDLVACGTQCGGKAGMGVFLVSSLRTLWVGSRKDWTQSAEDRPWEGQARGGKILRVLRAGVSTRDSPEVRGCQELGPCWSLCLRKSALSQASPCQSLSRAMAGT